MDNAKQAFSPFPMFSTLPKTYLTFSVTFILSSANAFHLDKSSNLSFGKELLFFTNDKALDESKLKLFTDDKVIATPEFLWGYRWKTL